MSTAEDTGTPFRGKIVQLPDAKGTGVGIDRGRAAFADLSPLISEAHTSDLELSQWRKLFEQIVAREAGTFELELGVPRFLAALGAGPVQKQQLGEIFEFLGGYQPGSRRANEDAQRTITQLHSARSFLRWYTTRLSVRDAYVSCMEGTGRKMPAPLKLEDALFSLRFEHDATLSGVAGMYVSTSQCWVGHFGEALWTEVTLSTKDGPVEVSPGWEAWSHLDPCSTPFPRKASRTFVSLMPFRPDSQSLFIDNLRLFVPYSALHLSPGKHDITVFARVMNSRGEELACSSEVTSLSSSVLRSRDRVLVASPQQLGYWKEDPVTRTGFLSTRVTRCTHSLGHSPLDTLRVRTEVRVSADSLCSLFLECRLLDDEGAPLLSALPEFADEQGMVYTSCELAPSSTSSVFSPLDLELPLCAVAQRDLPYESKKPFFVELVVRTDQGQIVCGVQEQVPAHYLSGVPVRTSLEGWQKTRDILCSESMHQIADILIDPLFPFGSTKAFRVSCHIDTPVGSDVPYRLRIDVR
ncbi:MAG: hypothetical protein KDD55_09970, partial [Bdellovibrionales bacterium]|nr:hypothetical protein [Bdellovibrionales bacterium]